LLLGLAPTRWKLRETLPLVNRTLAELQLRQHPDKTFIGRISRGVGVGCVIGERRLASLDRDSERTISRRPAAPQTPMPA